MDSSFRIIAAGGGGAAATAAGCSVLCAGGGSSGAVRPHIQPDDHGRAGRCAELEDVPPVDREGDGGAEDDKP